MDEEDEDVAAVEAEGYEVIGATITNSSRSFESLLRRLSPTVEEIGEAEDEVEELDAAAAEVELDVKLATKLLTASLSFVRGCVLGSTRSCEQVGHLRSFTAVPEACASSR